jgi:hypothetical protein
VLTQASASILGAHLSGADRHAVEKLREQVALMLQGGAMPPAPFDDYAVLMGATLFGYLVRLGIITVAVYVVADAAWVELIPLCATLIVAHLGLLVWELRYVSLSLAFPGVKPKKSDLISTTNGE